MLLHFKCVGIENWDFILSNCLKSILNTYFQSIFSMFPRGRFKGLPGAHPLLFLQRRSGAPPCLQRHGTSHRSGAAPDCVWAPWQRHFSSYRCVRPRAIENFGSSPVSTDFLPSCIYSAYMFAYNQVVKNNQTNKTYIHIFWNGLLLLLLYVSFKILVPLVSD